MRFTKLVVESFQAIQRAEVELGPGLNVLYGPNDLGKSTLATAIRAALLVPPTSAEAARYTPWYADATPRVELTFADDASHYWRVTKGFGGGAKTGAELEHSKDGKSFTLECKARQVEEKLRTLLAWGIAPPGGKGAPRGLPTSFLANVLLAAQTDVDGILAKSLADDAEGGGKGRLTRALATLAQDPLFKKVLDRAQSEVDLCFAPKGGRKKGQASKFTQAAKVVTEFATELTALKRQVDESLGIEQSVNALRERRAHAVMRVQESSDALNAVRQRLENTRVREAARARLDDAKGELAKLDAHVARVQALAGEVVALTARAKEQESRVAAGAAASDAADTALRAAEDAHRVATSEDGARARELRQAQLVAEAAGLTAKRQSADARKLTAAAAVAARVAAGNAATAAQTARAEHEKADGELTRSSAKLKDTEAELELARAIIAYGRWRVASTAADDAGKVKEAGAKSRALAAAKGAEATAADARASALEEELSARQAVLPSQEEAKVLDRLAHELEVAEAALGGGISVAVRPRTGVAVRAWADEKVALDEPSLSTERLLEADRNLRLSIGDLVELEITAGAADKRRAVEGLRARWRTEGVSVLERAGRSSLADVAQAIAALAKEGAVAAEDRKTAERLRAEAKSLADQAALQDEQAAKLAANVDDLDARKAAIGATDLALLETFFVKLGKSWDSQAEALHAARTKEVKALEAQVAKSQQAATLAEYRVSETSARATELSAARDEAFGSLASPDPDALLKAIDAELASLTQSEKDNAAQLSSLVAEASSEVAKAAAAVESAREAVRAAREARDLAGSALEKARAELNAQIGQHTALASQVEAMDRPGAEGRVKQREGELAALPHDPPVSEIDVQAAEREHETAKLELEGAKEELHKSEGALLKVGGTAVREEVQRIEEALVAAQSREKELEVDADAWKLLLETLRDVENKEGAHLGRALAGPITAKFVELTSGRYKGLRFDAELKTEGIDVATVATDADVLEALSTGTRNQLATLIRLTIAHQLKSAIILDDHLVHTDPARLAWFRDVLMRTALETQVIVLTCRPEDYLTREELPSADVAIRDLAGGAVRAIDMRRVMKRWAVAPSHPAPAKQPEPADTEA